MILSYAAKTDKTFNEITRAIDIIITMKKHSFLDNKKCHGFVVTNIILINAGTAHR